MRKTMSEEDETLEVLLDCVESDTISRRWQSRVDSFFRRIVKMQSEFFMREREEFSLDIEEFFALYIFVAKKKLHCRRNKIYLF